MYVNDEWEEGRDTFIYVLHFREICGILALPECRVLSLTNRRENRWERMRKRVSSEIRFLVRSEAFYRRINVQRKYKMCCIFTKHVEFELCPSRRHNVEEPSSYTVMTSY